ncbi:MAG TPA: hypothetical protein VHC69_15995 [Polyangiaceae bacterium]|nr:hypothetical protein [Polyangiaceae bacterium]
MSKRREGVRNVYIHVPEAVHLEIKTLALRTRQTTDVVYAEAARRLLREHGIIVSTELSLTTQPTASTLD